MCLPQALLTLFLSTINFLFHRILEKLCSVPFVIQHHLSVTDVRLEGFRPPQVRGSLLWI